MLRAFGFSLALHAAVVAALLMGLPHFGRELELGDGITVEVVALSELEELQLETPAAASPLPELQPTRTPDPTPPDTEPSPEPPGETLAPAPDPVPEPEAEQQAAPESPPSPVEPEPRPAEPEPQETVEAEPVPTPTPETGAEVEAPSPPAPTIDEAEVVEEAPEETEAPTPPVEQAALVEEPSPPAPVPRRRPGRPQPSPDATQQPPPEEDPFDALLQSVEQLDRRVQDDVERDTTGSAEAPSTAPQVSAAAQQRMVGLIRSQLYACWSVPVGIENARSVGLVGIETRLNPDGSLVSAQVEDRQRYTSDPTFRVVADSAIRAVTRCTPLRGLPPELYDQWRFFVFDFDPAGLTAGG